MLLRLTLRPPLFAPFIPCTPPAPAHRPRAPTPAASSRPAWQDLSRLADITAEFESRHRAAKAGLSAMVQTQVRVGRGRVLVRQEGGAAGRTAGEALAVGPTMGACGALCAGMLQLRTGHVVWAHPVPCARPRCHCPVPGAPRPCLLRSMLGVLLPHHSFVRVSSFWCLALNPLD